MASGLNEPETPLSPTAQTIAAPGLVDTEFSTLGLPASGLATVVHAVPFQTSENVNSMVNLGCTYLELSKFDLGLDCFRQALVVLDGLGDARACAEIRGRLDPRPDGHHAAFPGGLAR